MIADLVISGATIVSDVAHYPASLAIADGRIVAIGDTGTMPEARETLDATGLHLLPGAIDARVHFREPGYSHRRPGRPAPPRRRWAASPRCSRCRTPSRRPARSRR